MDFDDIVQLINQTAIDQLGRPLKDVERLVLKGAWDNQTYSAIAGGGVGYTEDYLKKDVGPKLWQFLSTLVTYGSPSTIKVNKRNLQNVLQHWASRQPRPPAFPPPAPPESSATLPISPTIPIDINDFCGRQADLDRLAAGLEAGWRLVVLWGQQGVGKTALAAALVQRLQQTPGADACRWGYLALTPRLTAGAVLDALVHWVGVPPYPLATPGAQVDWLLRQFQQRRHGLILDRGETLFDPQQPAGTYRAETAALHSFLQQVAELQHQSWVLWLGRQRPGELPAVGGHRTCAYPLGNLAAPDVQALWHQQGGTHLPPAETQAMLKHYGGNPFILKQLAATAQSLYHGQASPLLQSALPLPSSIQTPLDQALAALPPAEALLVYWLATHPGTVALTSLQTAMVDPLPPWVVPSLVGRSWCHPHQDSPGMLDLCPLVRAVALQRLLKMLLEELTTGQVYWLHRLPWITTTAPETIQAQQRAAILDPLATAFATHYAEADALMASFQRLHLALRKHTLHQPGYGAGNLMHLANALNLALAGADFSGLAIWHGDLRAMSLQGADFRQAQFRHTLFATALGRSPVVAISPDGQSLAAGDHEGRLLLWDLPRGRLQQVLDGGQSKAICALAFSANGAGLAVATEVGQIYLRPLQGNYQADLLVGHSTAVRALAFSADGRHLASGDDLGTIRLWTLPSGHCTGVLTVHQGAIHSLCFNPAGTHLLSSGDDQQACTFDVATGHRVHSFQGRATTWVHTAGFVPPPPSPDLPPQPFAAGYEEQGLTLWDMTTGRPRWILPLEGSPVMAMALSPNGRYLACSQANRAVGVWDIPQRRWCYTLPIARSPVWQLCFTPDSQALVTACDYTIRLWDVATGKGLRSWLSQAHSVRCLAFSHDSNQMITGHDDSQIRLSTTTPYPGFASPLEQLNGDGQPIRNLAVSTDGQWLASSSDDGTLRLWRWPPSRAANGSAGRPADHSGHCWNGSAPATLLAFSPDSRWLVSGGEDGILTLWSIPLPGQVPNQSQPQLSHQLEVQASPPSALAVGPEGTVVIGHRDGLISLGAWQQSNPIQRLDGHFQPVHSLAISQGGDWFASASADGPVRWWSFPTGDELGHWQAPPSHLIHGIAITQNERLLAVTSADLTVTVWDVQAHRCLHQLEGHTHTLWQVIFSPDCAYLATASLDDEIRIWQLDLGSCQQVLCPSRPYEGVNIRDASGLSAPELAMVKALGAAASY